MSQEGTNLPQEVQGSHDHAIGPHGNMPASVGSVIVMPASSNSSSIGILASKISDVGSEKISPAMLHAGEDNNATSKTTHQAVLHGCEDKVASKIAKQAVVHATKDNNALATSKLGNMVVLLAGEEMSKKARSKRPITMRTHADADSNAKCKRNILRVLHASNDNSDGSKITSLGLPDTIVDNTIRSEVHSPRVLQSALEITKLKVASQPVFHASEDKDNNIEVKVTGPMVCHAGEDKKVGSMVAIQEVPHAKSNSRSKIISTAVLHAIKDNNDGSKLTLQAVPQDSKPKTPGYKSTRPVVINVGKSKDKEGKNNVTREENSGNIVGGGRDGRKSKSLLSDGGDILEIDGGSGSGKGKGAAAVGYADHDFHIYMERERRKKMKNMFSTLHSLLPQLPTKADKATVVGEAVDYIKTLEGTVQKLEKLKLERMRAMAAQQQQGAGGSGMDYGWQAQYAIVVATAKAAAAAAATAAGMGSSSSTIAPRGSVLLPVPLPAPAPGFQTWSGQNIVVSVANNEAYINVHAPRQRGVLTKVLFVLERHHIGIVTTTVSTQGDDRMFGIHARINSTSAHFPENLSAEDRFKLVVSEMQQLINN